MRTTFLILLLLSGIFINQNCEKNKTPLNVINNDTIQPPDTLEPEITLSVPHPAGVNELWLQVQLNDVEFPAAFVLDRNGNFYKQFTLNNADTIISDDRLPVSTTFTYRAAFANANLNSDSSEIVVLTTRDSTTHDYSWERFEFGSGFSDNLLYAAIIDENNIWAVGELHAPDSAGESQHYNAVHWNGDEWEYIEITNVPVNAIFAFSANDIWVGTSAPYHWDGSEWTVYNVTGIFNGYIKEIWGSSSNNIIMVGTNGSIARFNGTSWQKMNSGTTIDLVDVWGSAGGEVVWACGRSSGGFESVLLRYNGSSWEKVWEKNGDNNNLPYYGTITGVWLNDDWEKAFIIGSYGLYRQSSFISHEVFQQLDRTVIPEFSRKIRGTAPNNVFFVGEFAMIMHYNGSSFNLYNSIYNPESLDNLKSVAVYGDIVVAVGQNVNFPSKGLILKGRRLNN